MATLDRIIEMQKNGIPDTEIATQLTNEGIPSADINNSLNQAKIKNAVSAPEATPQGQESMQGMGGMSSSIMQEDSLPMAQNLQATQSTGAQPPAPGQPAQAPQAAPAPLPPTPAQAPTEQNPEIYPSETQPIDPYYDQNQTAYQQDYYPAAEGFDTDTISEIAEQVATEKINEYKEKTGDILNFKNRIQEKVSDIDERLKRIETSIDKLQHAIIGKVGEITENSSLIHKDLDNLHGTVQKLMDPLVDNINALKKMSK